MSVLRSSGCYHELGVWNALLSCSPVERSALQVACLWKRQQHTLWTMSPAEGRRNTPQLLLRGALPVFPPDRYSADDIAFIVRRVMELVYTAGT